MNEKRWRYPLFGLRGTGFFYLLTVGHEVSVREGLGKRILKEEGNFTFKLMNNAT